MVSGIHNHALNDKLVGHPVICRLVPEERELVSDMTLNLVVPKNLFGSLKRKKPLNVSYIKQIYNMRARNNKTTRGLRYEMQQQLKFLEDDHYVSRYTVCKDKSIVRDIFWSHPDSIKLYNTFFIVLIIDSTLKKTSIDFHSWKLLVLLLGR